MFYRFDNLSHPLLLKLASTASGTYHHSLNVANLGRLAAKAIGANALQVRVGGYFHDIGKISQPQYFTENQNNSNPHQALANPRSSAKIVIGHVKEGVKLAKEYNLPQEIIDFIGQHHGNRPASYFLHEAKKRGLKIKKEDFHYPGPRPLCKETAIVMLADGIEAVVRSREDLTVDDLKKIAEEIVDSRNLEGQIKQAFWQGCQSIFHKRISYAPPLPSQH